MKNWKAKAEKLHARGDHQALIQYLLKAHENFPKDASLAYMIGITFWKEDNPQAALEFYDKSLAIVRVGEGAAKAHTMRGVALKRLQRLSEAIESWENAALASKNLSGSVAYNHACGQALAGNPAQALTYLDLAIIVDENYKTMAQKDEDFESLREWPAFQTLVRPPYPTSEPEGLLALMQSPYLSLQYHGFWLLSSANAQLRTIPSELVSTALDLLMHFGKPDLTTWPSPYYELSDFNNKMLTAIKKRNNADLIAFVDTSYLTFIQGIDSIQKLDRISGRISTLLQWIQKSPRKSAFREAIMALLQRILDFPPSFPPNLQLAVQIEDLLKLYTDIVKEPGLLLARELRPLFLQLLVQQSFGYNVPTEEAFYMSSDARGELALAMVHRLGLSLDHFPIAPSQAHKDALLQHASLLLQLLYFAAENEPSIAPAVMTLLVRPKNRATMAAMAYDAAHSTYRDAPEVLNHGLLLQVMEQIETYNPASKLVRSFHRLKSPARSQEEE